MRKFLLPAVAAAAVFAAGCGGSGESSQPVATSEVQMVKSYRFDPKVIEIEAGQTVTWTNEDGTQHTVTADGDGDFDVTVPAGEDATFTAPDTAGAYKFHCSIHPQMKATLTVE